MIYIRLFNNIFGRTNVNFEYSSADIKYIKIIRIYYSMITLNRESLNAVANPM